MFEAGVRFGNECFVRFEYNESTNDVAVTVITPEETLTGLVTLTVESDDGVE